MIETLAPAPAPIAHQRPYRRSRRTPASVYQTLVWGAVAVLALAPLIPLVVTSLRSKPYYLPGGVFSTNAYRQLLTDPAFHTAAVNTALFATTATILAVVLGGGFAVLVSRTNLPGARIIGLLLIGPLLIPSLGLIVGWEAIYGPLATSANCGRRTCTYRSGTSPRYPGWRSWPPSSPCRSRI
jgi:iron(III) transport system permease protein